MWYGSLGESGETTAHSFMLLFFLSMGSRKEGSYFGNNERLSLSFPVPSGTCSHFFSDRFCITDHFISTTVHLFLCVSVQLSMCKPFILTTLLSYWLVPSLYLSPFLLFFMIFFAFFPFSFSFSTSIPSTHHLFFFILVLSFSSLPLPFPSPPRHPPLRPNDSFPH